MKSTTLTLRRVAVAVALALVACGHVPAMIDEEEYKEQQAQRSRDALRQLTIMAKVLETRLQEELSGDLVTGGIFQRGGVGGFHVPGVGAVFQFNVSFPLAERKPPAKAAEPEADDLWRRIERGEETKPSFFTGVGRDAMGVDPFGNRFSSFDSRAPIGYKLSRDDRRKIEKLESVVLETLAEYGDRMTSIEPNENIIILAGGQHKGGFPGLFSSLGPNTGEYAALSMALVGPSTGEDIEEVTEPGDELATAEADAIDDEARKLQDQLRSVEARLRDLENELKVQPDAENLDATRQALRTLVEEQKNALRAYPKLADRFTAIKDSRNPRLVRRRVPIVGSRTALATSWVLKVKKGDLVKDPDELRKVAVIESR